MRVLIVDDDIAYLQLLSIILKSKNHKVIEARDGKSAWRCIQNDPVPFVITDWMLPEMDGLDLIRRIRAADFPTYTYIILLTAKHTKGDIVNGLESGADDYLTKPFDLDELRARINIGERIISLETRQRETMAQLYKLATRDNLTGLLNRSALYERAEKELSRAIREQAPLSMIMMDIDHFKNINDNFGHLVGDKALCSVADSVSRKKRQYDLIGRWGGEEFLLILPGTDAKEALLVAERLREEVATTSLSLPGADPIHVKVSIGIACLQPNHMLSFDDLLQRADHALYQAKNQGRDRVCLYSEE
jgi:two-component system, cell cycle response regulator